MTTENVTLTSGMRNNLYALQQTASQMNIVQQHLATGKKVNSALDDPVNFFNAKQHYDRASDLSSKKDGMSEAMQVIQAANNGITGINDLLDQMKSLAEAAKTSNNTNDLANQFDTIRSQIKQLASDSSYGGSNLLNNDSLSVEFNADGSSKLAVAGFSATSVGTIDGKCIGSANFSNNTSIESSVTQIDNAVSQLRTASQKLASSLSTIQIRSDFTDQMVNTLNTGGDNLTLADTNQEGANMLMLQTQQQLGTTSLSMSSQAAQAVLRLF